MIDLDKLRDMNDAELSSEESKLTSQLFKLRVQKAKGQLENAQRVKVVRRDIARIKTLIRERQIAEEGSNVQG